MSHARKAEGLARTCPDFCANIDASAFEGDLKWVGDWDSEQIGVWFSERRIKAGVGPDRSYGELQKRKRLWGNSRWVEIDTHEGWAIPNGLSSYLLIMLDGRVCATPGGFPGYDFHGPPEIRPLELRHLDAIAEILGLPSEVEIANSYTI